MKPNLIDPRDAKRGFSLTFPNGCRLTFEEDLSIRKRKSWNVLFNNGYDKVYRKIGLIQDVETLRQIVR